MLIKTNKFKKVAPYIKDLWFNYILEFKMKYEKFTKTFC